MEQLQYHCACLVAFSCDRNFKAESSARHYSSFFAATVLSLVIVRMIVWLKRELKRFLLGNSEAEKAKG